MEMIILDDGMYHLIPVTKEMLKDLMLVVEVNCLKLTTYSDSLNIHMMNDDSGDFFGCMCR